MTLHEVKEVYLYAKQCGIKCDYKRKDIFEYEVKMLDETFTSRKQAIKFINKVFDANRLKNRVVVKGVCSVEGEHFGNSI